MGPGAQESIRASLVSAGAKIGWFGVEVGRWMCSLRLSTSNTAANLIRRKRKVSNLNDELMNAIMDAMTAQLSMSRQALNSEALRARMLATILDPGKFWG